MTGKMEMSLDDIIKQSKGGRTGNRRGGGGAKGGSPRRGPPSQNRRPGGGVQRGRTRGGISRSTSGFGRSTMPSYKREAFLGSSGGGLRRFGGGSEATKLIVSNLDFGVTDSDILELFGEFGPLKSAGVHYDRSGRSLGSADLIFERRSDAIKAMKQYNGVPLDGREMNIQLATSEIPSSRPIIGQSKFGRSNSGGIRYNKGGSPNRRPGGRGGAGGNRPNNRGPQKGGKPGGGRQKKPAPPTAEELDAQLEEYVKSKVASSEGA